VPMPQASPDTTITYRVLIAGDSCITVDTVKVTVIPVRMEEFISEVQVINVFPTPFNEVATLKWKEGKYDDIELEIFNVLGSLVRKEKYPTSNKLVLYRRDLNPGFYQFSLNTENKVIGIGKFLIK